MDVRYINKPDEVFYSNCFNISSCFEVLICNSKTVNSEFIYKLEVKIKDKWILMKNAFKNHDLITDTQNSYFFEPTNEIDKKRGYCL